MKILYLHQYFNSPNMVGGTRSYEMAKRMAAAGHDVHIISSWREKSDRRSWWHENIDGINVHWLPVSYDNRMNFFQRMAAFTKFALFAGRKAASLGGDIVFATSTPLTIAIPGIYASRRLRVPMVFEVRDLWPELPIAVGALRNPILKKLARWLERYAYRNSARIVALSPGMAQGVKNCGYPSEKISVIPNSCDNALFAPSEDGARKFRSDHPELGAGPIVLYAGTFGRINGVRFMPELAARLQIEHPDVRFVAIGSGAEFEMVRAHAKDLKVLGVNYFQYDAMPKYQLIDAFRAASVSTSFVVDLPELWNNSANKFFDTLASGTAVAINHQGWQADLIKEFNVGIVLGPEVEIAASRLSDLLNDRSSLDIMGANARELALEKFDRDDLAADLMATLEQAIAPIDNKAH